MRTLTRCLATLALLTAICGSAGCARDAADKTKSNASSQKVQSQQTSDISSDETLVFFPTYAYLDKDGKTWTVPIHGIIFEPETDSVRRGATMAAMAEMLAVEPDSPQAETLRRRMALFLVDNERGKDIFVRIGPQTYAAGTSEANGHFQKDLRLAAAEVQPGPDGWIVYRAATPISEQRSFDGQVQPVGPTGISIISDIDDTIKHSQVTDRKALLANTFLRKFKPVPGMAELYRDCARKGAVFHYVSGSPWQLYQPLAEFIRDEGFPRGSFTLRQLRLKDPSTLGLAQRQEGYKLHTIESIIKAFPQRRFILIGDSGEQDPEIYAMIARRHPEQIAAILIHNVTAAKPDDARFKAVQEGLGDARFMLFDEPNVLRPAMEALFKGQK